MGILGIYASSVLKVTNSYESIATVTVGSGGSGTITFSSIPSTYKHLQLRAIARTNAGGEDYNKFTQNGVTSATYSYHQLTGNGSSASAAGGASSNETYPSHLPGSSSGASIFGTFVIDLLDYQNTSKYKTIRTLGGYDNNGGGRLGLYSGLFMNTAAVSSLTLTPGSGTLYVEFSKFALYGIKG